MCLLRLSAASAFGPPAAQPLRVIGAPDGASGRLLCVLWDERQCAHAVDVWRVSGGGQSIELVGCALSGADDESFDFECWLANDRIL